MRVLFNQTVQAAVNAGQIQAEERPLSLSGIARQAAENEAVKVALATF